jgi:hypothetical protein
MSAPKSRWSEDFKQKYENFYVTHSGKEDGRLSSSTEISHHFLNFDWEDLQRMYIDPKICTLLFGESHCFQDEVMLSIKGWFTCDVLFCKKNANGAIIVHVQSYIAFLDLCITIAIHLLMTCTALLICSYWGLLYVFYVWHELDFQDHLLSTCLESEYFGKSFAERDLVSNRR